MHKKEKSSDTKPIKIKHLAGQKSGYCKGEGFYLHDALPLSKRYADVAKEMFAFEGKDGVGFSSRSKESIDNGRKEVYNSKRKVRSYIHPSRIYPSDYRSLRSQLKKLYAGEDGIADDLAIAVENTIYGVDSAMDEGKLSFGVYEIINVSDDYDIQEAVRRFNHESSREGEFSRQVSDSLGLQRGADNRGDRRDTSGQELRGDSQQPQDNQGGISGASRSGGVRLQVKNSDRVSLKKKLYALQDEIHDIKLSDGYNAIIQREHLRFCR
ncbi:MAG: hypothetical protein J6W28_01565 [Clostridia bacterium]|nr:hypothetical protein [Clostridia bacterium]